VYVLVPGLALATSHAGVGTADRGVKVEVGKATSMAAQGIEVGMHIMAAAGCMLPQPMDIGMPGGKQLGMGNMLPQVIAICCCMAACICCCCMACICCCCMACCIMAIMYGGMVVGMPASNAAGTPGTGPAMRAGRGSLQGTPSTHPEGNPGCIAGMLQLRANTVASPADLWRLGWSGSWMDRLLTGPGALLRLPDNETAIVLTRV